MAADDPLSVCRLTKKINIPEITGQVLLNNKPLTKPVEISAVIYLAREFYGLDTDPETAAQPQFLSTLDWQTGIITDEKGEAELRFHTADITGTFRIVVQSVGMDDMVFGQKTFEVK